MTKLTALILAGGAGTRLNGLYPDVPKALVPVAGKPFLHWLIASLRHEGLTDFVFSLGHRGEQIERWLGEDEVLAGVRWLTFHETKPLGTGGGMRACLPLCDDNVLVINGDALLHAPLAHALETFNTAACDGVLMGVPVENADRFGSLVVNKEGCLTAFKEKRPGSGLINAGLYFMRKSILEAFPMGQNLSMEYDIIPKLILDGRRLIVHATAKNTPFIDIGTPQSAKEAEGFIRKYLMEAV